MVTRAPTLSAECRCVSPGVYDKCPHGLVHTLALANKLDTMSLRALAITTTPSDCQCQALAEVLISARDDMMDLATAVPHRERVGNCLFKFGAGDYAVVLFPNWGIHILRT